MNLSDLRDELTAHADDVGAAPDLRAGVAARVRATKRRRAAVAGSVATLTVAALAVGAVASLDRPVAPTPAGSVSTTAPRLGTDGMPYRVVPVAAGDVVKDGLRYRAQVADDRLAAGFIGERGQGQFSLVWTPTTTHVSIGAECYLPGLTDVEAAKYLVTVGLEGTKGFLGSTCSAHRPMERDLPAGGGIPGEPGGGWTELRVGQTARLRVQLVDARTSRPVSVDAAQLTGAVYELGAQQPVEDEAARMVAALPTVIEHQGYRYRLAGIATGPLASGELPELGVPGNVYGGLAVPDGPFLVTWGSAGTDLAGIGSADSASLRLEGLRDGTEARSYGAWGTTTVPAGSAQHLKLVAEGGRPNHGTGFIAIYTLDTVTPTP